MHRPPNVHSTSAAFLCAGETGFPPQAPSSAAPPPWGVREAALGQSQAPPAERTLSRLNAATLDEASLMPPFMRGGVPERPNGAVSKTVRGASPSRVQIPPPPLCVRGPTVPPPPPPSPPQCCPAR